MSYNTMLGADAQMGKYELIPGSGIWLPDASELAAGAAAGSAGVVATTAAKSPGIQTAAKSAGVQSIIDTVAAHPMATLVGVGSVIAGIAYVMSKK